MCTTSGYFIWYLIPEVIHSGSPYLDNVVGSFLSAFYPTDCIVVCLPTTHNSIIYHTYLLRNMSEQFCRIACMVLLVIVVYFPMKFTEIHSIIHYVYYIYYHSTILWSVKIRQISAQFFRITYMKLKISSFNSLSWLVGKNVQSSLYKPRNDVMKSIAIIRIGLSLLGLNIWICWLEISSATW